MYLQDMPFHVARLFRLIVTILAVINCRFSSMQPEMPTHVVHSDHFEAD